MTEYTIVVSELCQSFEAEEQVLMHLAESGIINVRNIQGQWCLPVEDLPLAERLLRLHTDLGINTAGLETICHLLDRLDESREELRKLRNRLSRYEGL